ncbi:MAG: hypothetical protein JSW64_14270 [Candidatus Zixiibacteriota bacterium]|nr:MAG: hypothetical protein JSW64_14270 [candidate division Zixibacteria bacterium]
MKVHGFDNTIPPPEDGRKTNKPAGQPSPDSSGEKVSGKSGDPGKHISPGSGSGERIFLIKDIIELEAKRIPASGNGDISGVACTKDTVDPGNRSQDGLYSIEKISKPAADSSTTSHKARLAKIRRNIADGYYNSPEFIERLAEILIDRFNLQGESE